MKDQVQPCVPHDSRSEGIVANVLALVANDGSGAHRYLASGALLHGAEAARNAADAVHHLALLHARNPGIIENAVTRTTDRAARKILAAMADAFADERELLTGLVVAAGPLPSTPGQANAESAMLAQHHAVEMLGLSDRNGCATGAALALAADWVAIRKLLDYRANRLALEVPATLLADSSRLAASFHGIDFGAAAERAMLFGAQQIVAQHRGMWDLLEARSIARGYN